MGVAVTALATLHNLSASSLHRHKVRHLPEPAEVEDVEISDIGTRVSSLADDLRRERLAAQASHQRTTATRLAAVELRALDMLATRLGIEDTSALEALTDARSLVQAVGRFARTHPIGAAPLIAEIRAADLEDVADQLEAISRKSEIAA
ncbi:hypothetical protein [Agromyces sp. NPDC057865]|uniref:hypothetical protein n=1 Tax=Agromyces sp. NPDC057865 TaxID=3346267 RepID=UPI0036706C6F